MNSIQSYKDLKVWQKSMDLVVLVYNVTKTLPETERFGLTSQMRRAAVSIPSNIVEGRHRSSKPDYIRFLYISFGSIQELNTQLEICKRLQLLQTNEVVIIFKKLEEISKMLFAMIKNLRL